MSPGSLAKLELMFVLQLGRVTNEYNICDSFSGVDII